MRYMVVERFTHGPAPVYERFAERGRMAPPGLEYVESWIDEKLDRCFQIMNRLYQADSSFPLFRRTRGSP